MILVTEIIMVPSPYTWSFTMPPLILDHLIWFLELTTSSTSFLSLMRAWREARAHYATALFMFPMCVFPTELLIDSLWNTFLILQYSALHPPQNPSLWASQASPVWPLSGLISGVVADEMLHSWMLMQCLTDMPPRISGGKKCNIEKNHM